MAAKYQLMTELYRRTGIEITRNTQVWQNFLASACHNYKCRFDEQLLIYAQRPDATAVAEISTWNRLFKRWVNKNSKAIVVFDTKGQRNTLKYYFDVSDTHAGYYGSQPVPIWQMDRRYEQPVIERLSGRFGETKSSDFASVLMETAENAVSDNLTDYLVLSEMCKSKRISRTAHLQEILQTSMIQARQGKKGVKRMNEITYSRQGDYLIPDLTLATEPELPLGRYALMHRDYLENHKKVTYLNLLTTGRLNAHLYQTEQTALQRLEILTKQLAKEQGVTEELKEKIHTPRHIRPAAGIKKKRLWHRQ